VVAKTDTAHRALASAFAQRKVRKVYLALVWGHPDPAEGTVDAGIGRSRSDPTRMSTRAPRRRDALTTFATCERMPGFALLRVQLVTGRTHQIRVHMQSLHHPIVGDARYGAQPWRGVRDPRKRMALAAFQRIALHAAELSFTHPVTGRTIELTAPLPREFEDLLSVLREVP
jgi:23S rRNA pseudouridine1911/1915/1917 synthase